MPGYPGRLVGFPMPTLSVPLSLFHNSGKLVICLVQNCDAHAFIVGGLDVDLGENPKHSFGVDDGGRRSD